MSWTMGTWHQVVQSMVQPSLNSKCINTRPFCSVNLTVKCNSKTCEGEMRVEVPNMFLEIFSIIRHLTYEQSF